MAKRNKRITKEKVIVALCIIALIAIIIYLTLHKLVLKKIYSINFKDIDKTSISVNNGLYDKVSNEMTEKEFKAVKKIVLFGIDTQGKGDGQDNKEFLGRSDSIIIASINPKYKSLKMISIPRDTYAEIEGHGKMKINHAYAFGKEQLAMKTINQNFGLDITEYATVDFAGLVHVINDIGGIKLRITKEEKEFINGASERAYQVSGNRRKMIARIWISNIRW